MKTKDNHGNTTAAPAGKKGQQELADREKEIEKTGGDRKDRESPLPNADQYRSKDHTSKPQHDEHDEM